MSDLEIAGKLIETAQHIGQYLGNWSPVFRLMVDEQLRRLVYG